FALPRTFRRPAVEDDEPPFDAEDVRPVMVRGRREPVMAESRPRPAAKVAAPPMPEEDDDPGYAAELDDEPIFDLRA
ncbi:hypothetical protein J8J40_35150, partial [Mycobacterium tuberculosis]|nr:hypothetical protein [Mycobacterium tuberculosis]